MALLILLSGVAVMFAAPTAFYWAQWRRRVNVASWVAAMAGGPLAFFTLDEHRCYSG